MYVCMHYVCMYACMCVCMYLHIYITCICVCIYIHTHTQICMYIYTYVYINTHTCVHICVCTRACPRSCVCVCVEDLDFLLDSGCKRLVELPWYVQGLHIRHFLQIVMHKIIAPSGNIENGPRDEVNVAFFLMLSLSCCNVSITYWISRSTKLLPLNKERT